MNILRSMTGATPETRLVLIIWAARFRTNFQSGTRSDLALALGVSKYHLDRSLGYLVNEGYLWKIKSPIKRPIDEQSKLVLFDYGLTTASWNMWCETVAACAWKDELIYALEAKLDGITINMRLLWISLLMKSNIHGYLMGYDCIELGSMVGMIEVKCRRVIRALMNKKIISMKANAVESTEMLERLPPIYQIHPQRLDCKAVKMAVNLSEGILGSFRFIHKLQTFYRHTSHSEKEIRFARHDTMLKDEQYFELSKIFTNKKLVGFVQQLCLLVIFEAASSYNMFLIGPPAPSEGHVPMSHSVWLWQLIRNRLQEGLTTKQTLDNDLNHKNEDESALVQNNEVLLLKHYTFDTLSYEMVSIVEQLAKQWNIFSDIYGERGKLAGYEPGYRMVVSINENNVRMTGDSSRSENAQNLETSKDQTDNFSFLNTLIVNVPNEDKYSDCAILGDKLYKC